MKIVKYYLRVIIVAILIISLEGCGQERKVSETRSTPIIEEKNAIVPISSNDYIGADYLK